jgi:hypothetical protein
MTDATDREVREGERPINRAWRAYAERVIPLAASDVQRRECRRAFFAGANALFGHLMTMFDPGEEATDADLARMAAIDAELKQFLHDLLGGRE